MFSKTTIQHLSDALESQVDTDVTVVGGGTAGWAAALASARTGAQTTIVESLSFLGGTMTGGMVLGHAGLRHQGLNNEEQDVSFEGEQVIRGVAQEYLDRLVALGGAWGRKGAATTRVNFDHELVKIVLDDMLTEAGVDIWFNTQLVDVVMDGPRVVGVVVSNNSGLHAIWSKAVVDSSGDGQVAYRAGAPYEVGRPQDGRPQPSTLYFCVGGVDLEKTLNYLKANPDELRRGTGELLEQALREGKPVTFRGFERLRKRAIENGDFPQALGAVGPVYSFGAFRTLWRGGRADSHITIHNIDTAFGITATDTKQLAQVLIYSRRFVKSMVDVFRKYIPGYENAYLLMTAPMLGVRETRRIMGDYVLTVQDVLEGREFMDAIGRCGAYVDIHDVDGGVRHTYHEEAGGTKGWYGIPYRILLPRGVEGVLTAGRCVSADHVAHGSIRQQGGCMATGHAAGTAAALAARAGLTPRSLEVEALQTTLRQQGAII